MKWEVAAIVLLCFTWTVGCGNQPDANESTDSPEIVTPPGTNTMAAKLRAISDAAQPADYLYLNTRLAAQYHEQMANLDGVAYLNMQLKYAHQLLISGQSEAAISEFNSLIQTMKQNGMEPPIAVMELLALSYLRLGEQQNCLENHSNASCIIPFRADAIHQLSEGSDKAIEIYKQILRAEPGNLQSRWLLNIAYMTLDQYPGQVPPEFLIPEKYFQSGVSFPRFEDVAGGSGIDVNGLSGGCIMDDFNNDGFLDIFATSYGLTDPVKLFFNDGNGRFTDVTAHAGLDGIVSGLNCLQADYDNDGYLDILVLRGAWLGKVGNHPNSLLHNRGDGTFEDVTFAAGLGALHPTQTADWADVDLDGYVDLFIGNESTPDNPHPCILYKNNGDGTFTDITQSSGINVTEYIKGVCFGDINNDRWPDIYISNLYGANKLFVNQGPGDSTHISFKEVAKSAGVQLPTYSFPCWFWDVNNDGKEDLFVADYHPSHMQQVGRDVAAYLLKQDNDFESPKLYLNTGNNTFRDVTGSWNLGLPLFAMGSNFGDLDNDGWLDFYIGNGAPDFRSLIPNRMYRNNAGKSFEDVTFAGGFGHLQKGHAIAFGDVDNDGDQDIYCVMGGALEGDVYTNMLYENPGFSNHWITLELQGTQSNKAAIGAKIDISITEKGQERHIWRTVGSGGSFGASSLQQEIGLGKADDIVSITIYWPTKTDNIQTFRKPAMDKRYVITEGTDTLTLKKGDEFQLAPASGGHHHAHNP